MAKTLFREDFLEIVYDKDNALLYANWKGYQTDQSVKDGINRLIELVADHHVSRILNDNSNALGIWTGVATWLVGDALPRAEKAGLKSFAHVFGNSRFSRVSAEAALLLLRASSVHIKTFDDIESAMRWLARRQ